MMTTEQAIATIEAFIAGGDELGIVSEDEACDALQAIRERIKELESQLATTTAPHVGGEK